MRLIFFLSSLFLSLAAAAQAGEGCLSAGCHPAFATMPGAHAPVAAGECRVCHLPHGADAPSLLTAPVPGLCLGCHPQIETRLRQSNVRHAPLYRERSCLECHAAHASPQPKLLAWPEQELCLSCHGRDDYSKSKALRNVGRELQRKKQLHGPIAAGGCVDCHAPHGSDYYRLLSAPYPEAIYAEYRPETYAFCFTCHDRALLEKIDAAGVTGFRNGDRNLHRLHVVEPRKGRTCRTCHAPHAGGERLLIEGAGAFFGKWRIPLDVKMTPSGGRCASGCHMPVEYDRENPRIYELTVPSVEVPCDLSAR